MAWNYVTENSEAVKSVEWFSSNNPTVSIATHFFASHFKIFFANPDNFLTDFKNVTFTPTANVTLHNVTSSATGTYTVKVDLDGDDPDNRTVNLVVLGK
jgi:hypothetical protein